LTYTIALHLVSLTFKLRRLAACFIAELYSVFQCIFGHKGVLSRSCYSDAAIFNNVYS